MPEILPENNGYWSSWRDVPTERQSWWMKPGMLKHLPTRKVGDAYDPFRANEGDVYPAGYTGTNYWRYHFSPPPDNNVYRVDYYNDRETNQGGYPNAFQIMHMPYAGIYETDWYLSVTLPDETFSSGWVNFDTSLRSYDVTGVGMMKQYIANNVPESYYRFNNFLDWFRPTNSPYFINRPGSTITNTTSGRNDSYRYSVACTNGYAGMQSKIPMYESATNFYRPYHTYRASAWIRSTAGSFANAGVFIQVNTRTGGSTWKHGSLKTINAGGDWQYVYCDFLGKELYQMSLYYGTAPNIVWGTNEFISSTASRTMQLEDVQLVDLTVGSQNSGVYRFYYPDSYCAVRQDSASSGTDIFQFLYDSYGVGGGGEGHPPRTFERVRDATGFSTSKSSNNYDRSYAGQKDPRLLSRPINASFGYSRWMDWHPFCYSWYWTLNASTATTVGNSYYSWADIDNYRVWEQMLPSDVEPDFPSDLPYTWHRQNNPPAINWYPTGFSVNSTYTWWRSVQFDGAPEIVDSKFEIEVSDAAYSNNSGASGCFINPAAPPIPPESFYLYAVEGNGNNYASRWPKQAILNGSLGDLVLTITPQWSGSQNGSWTLTGVIFSGMVDSTYTLDTADDLGMSVSRTLYGCIPTIKPTDYTSRKVSFYLVEHWSKAQSVPWFITEYDPEANRGNFDPTGGFGTVHDLTTNSYGNSLTVGIQPVLKVQLPSKWRYAIPWGTDTGDATEPPLRMNQRNDGVGTFEGHARITGAGSNTYSSINGPRIPGLGSTYR